jgi:hypothetical protein
MQLPVMLDDLVTAKRALADSFRVVSIGHPQDADVHFLTMAFARECDEQVSELRELSRRFDDPFPADSGDVEIRSLMRAHAGPLGLLRDLQDLHARADRVNTIGQAVRQAALVLEDRPLVRAVDACREQTQKQMDWLRTALDKASPQALIVG